MTKDGKPTNAASADADAPNARVSLALGLFSASFLSLFFELLVIRWLTSDFVSFGVFKTFPLIACFVGLGTGVARADHKYFQLAPFALLVTVVTILSTSLAGYGDLTFPSLALYQWDSLTRTGMVVEVLKMTLLVILLLMGPFAVMFTIGTLIGYFFNRLKPLKAYCVDIGGAIVGSIIFALLSFLSFSPNMEIVIVAAMMAVLMFAVSRSSLPRLAVLAATTVIALLPVFNPPGTSWTPYYRLDVQEVELPASLSADGKQQKLGITVNTNHGFSQSYTNNNDLQLSELGQKTEPARLLKDFLTVRKNYYELPYLFKKPKEVLILGAGSGSDIAEAVRQGATWIDAVEIDSGVRNLAKKYNVNYFAPQVHYHLNDGRKFLTTTDKKYDMVILACLDSRAVSGNGSSVRTDCYIHTAESYADCVKHLKDDGVLALSFGASVGGNSQWLRDRIYKTLEHVTGYPPLVMSDEDAKYKWPAYFFITGKPVKDGLLKAPVNPDGFSAITMPKEVQGIVLGDDWPFLYVREKSLDIPYLFVLTLITAITLYVGRSVIFGPKSSVDVQLFGLGAAFILLELQAISRLSLIFGATWVTSSVVINGVLLMILAANFIIIQSKKPFSQDLLYWVLFGTIAASYVLPVSTILSQIPGAGGWLCTLITLLPIFVVGLIFATAFKVAVNPSRSFAFNLLGSVLGGLLEYLSTYIGINNLLLVSLALYGWSYMAMRKAASEAALPAAEASSETVENTPV